MYFIPVLILIVGGIVLLKTPDEKSKLYADIFIFSSALLCLASAVFTSNATVSVLTFGSDLHLQFSCDTLSRFFLGLVSVVFGFVQFYSPGYMDHEGHQSRFYAFYQFTFAALIGVGTAANAITYYMCFELMTLLSMPLVLHNGTEVSRTAAFKYLGYSTLGASLALLGLFIASNHMSSLVFVPGGVNIDSSSETLMTAAYFLVFIGFGCKAGLAPLQMWLTEAHPVAPSPASAVLSGIITKSGVLAIIRFTFYLFGTSLVSGSWAQSVLTVMALSTIFMGSMLASREGILKKRLAYSTISNVSYVLFGILTLNATAFHGALLQMTFHALAKDTLFLVAGGIILKTGYTNVSQLKGVGKRMPVSMWCFTIASLSLVGIPPLGGFVSKWYLCTGAIAGNYRVGIIATFVLMLSALLTAFYLLSICADAFFPGKEYSHLTKCELNKRMLIPIVVFTLLLFILGVFPKPLLDLFTALGNIAML